MATTLQGNTTSLQGSGAGLLQGGMSNLQGSSPIIQAPQTSPAAPIAASDNGIKANAPVVPTQPNRTIPASSQPKINDVSDKYANVNGTIYDINTDTPYSSSGQFFKDSGLSSFNNVKFNTTYTPPLAVSSSAMPNSVNSASAPAGGTTGVPAWQPGDTPTTQDQAIQNETYYGQQSDAEKEALGALNNYQKQVANTDANIETQAIPVGFMTGQQATNDKLAAINEGNLQQTVSNAQTDRQLKESAAAAEAGQLAPIQVSPGNEAVSPTTGSVVASQPLYTPTTNPATGALATVNATTGDVNNNYGSNSSTGTYGSAATSNGLLGVGATQNNPTGLKDPSTGQFATYPTVQAGLDAAANQFSLYQNGQSSSGITGTSTLNQAIAKWNNNGQYNGDDVAKTLASMGVSGVTGNTPISQLNASQVAEAIANHETGYTPGSSTSQNSNTGYGPKIDSAVSSALKGIPLDTLGLSDAQKSTAIEAAKKQDPNFNDSLNSQNFAALSAAKQATVTAAAQKSSAISAADGVLEGTLQKMSQLASQVNLSGFPELDQFLQGKSSQYSNNPQLAAFKTLWSNAVTQYAIISSGGNGQPDQGDLSGAQNFIPAAGNSDVYTSLYNTLSDTAQREVSKQQDIINGQLGGDSSTSSGSGSSVDLSKYNFSLQ